MPPVGGGGSAVVTVHCSDGGKGAVGTLIFEGNATGVFAVWREGMIGVEVREVEDVVSLAAPLAGYAVEGTRMHARVPPSEGGGEYAVSWGIRPGQVMSLARECGEGEGGGFVLVREDGGREEAQEAARLAGLPLQFGNGGVNAGTWMDAERISLPGGTCLHVEEGGPSRCGQAVERARAYAAMGDAESAMSTCDGALGGGRLRLLCDGDYASLLTAQAAVIRPRPKTLNPKRYTPSLKPQPPNPTPYETQVANPRPKTSKSAP